MLLSFLPAICCASLEEDFASKPPPDEVLALLKAGNKRFVQSRQRHPHLDKARRKLAVSENQSRHACATVLSCSDSRVPVEAIFDAGIMDLFVVRMAGFACTSNGIGCIEYGVLYVHTPLVIVLGHTQCGAVTAATLSHQGRGQRFEKNIAPLLNYVRPAVERAAAEHPDIDGDHLIPFAIEENIRQGREKFLQASAASRRLVQQGKLKVVGGLYDIGSGYVHWLPDYPPAEPDSRIEKAFEQHQQELLRKRLRKEPLSGKPLSPS